MASNKSKIKYLSKIKKIAKDQKKTLYQVAKDSGLIIQEIYRWDRHEPSVEKLLKVCKVLNISVEELINKKD